MNSDYCYNWTVFYKILQFGKIVNIKFLWCRTVCVVGQTNFKSTLRFSLWGHHADLIQCCQRCWSCVITYTTLFQWLAVNIFGLGIKTVHKRKFWTILKKKAYPGHDIKFSRIFCKSWILWDISSHEPCIPFLLRDVFEHPTVTSLFCFSDVWK